MLAELIFAFMAAAAAAEPPVATPTPAAQPTPAATSTPNAVDNSRTQEHAVIAQRLDEIISKIGILEQKVDRDIARRR